MHYLNAGIFNRKDAENAKKNQQWSDDMDWKKKVRI